MTEATIVNKKRWRFSPIWFLPFTALLLVILLAYESYMHRGVSVTIRFTTGSGISVKKTKVMYKGIAIGKVTDVEIDKNDIEQVIVTILLDKRTRPYLLSDTQFWLVKPSVSLGGISGLDTLVSGNYIAMNPGFKGTPKLDYIALKEAPIESKGKSGLHLHLIAKTRGSIVPMSPIYYKKIKVGEGLGSKYNKHSQDVTVMLKIEEKYAYLVKKQSRFYNVSGIQMKGGLNGFKIQTESLASIVIGGLAFYNPENAYLDETAEDGDKFPLFDNFESADIGIPIILQLNNADNLQEGITEIKYLGAKVGFIKKIITDYKTGKIKANAFIKPSAESLLKTGTQIWKVKPILSLNQISGIETLIKGVYLAIRPGKGKTNSTFQVLETPPSLDITEPGLHIKLNAKRLGSIQIGSGVYFKNIKIGKVQAYHLDDLSSDLSIQLLIQPQYSNLIQTNSRFHQKSGINIKGSLSGVSIQTDSLSSIMSGGISIYNPPSNVANSKIKIAQNGDIFELYDNKEKANSDSEIAIYFKDVTGIKEQITKVRYKGIELGYVDRIIPDKKLKKIKVIVKIAPIAHNFLKKYTRFWLVKAKINLPEVSGLETIIGGNYITLQPGYGKLVNSFVALESAPDNIPANALELIIKTPELGSISIGAPVLYHQLEVGSISSYRLDKSADFVLVTIHIINKYRNLVKANSRFYQASGFSLKGGLTGLDFRTESISALIKGGIAFITPKISAKTTLVKNQQIFHLHADLQSAKLDRFKVFVRFTDAQGLRIGTKVKLSGVEVGEVKKLKLHKDLKQVVVELFLDNKLRKVLGHKSRFRKAKAEFGLAKTQHLDTLVTGSYIVLEPITGKFSSNFTAQEMVSQKGLPLTLVAQQLGSIKKGNPVSYRQVQVGKVTGFELSKTADQVLIHILIEQQYAPLVRKDSKFWNASGINMDINLFAASKIKTESIQSILDGGISFATPANAIERQSDSYDQVNGVVTIRPQNLAKRAQAKGTFILHKEVKPSWLEWNPKIPL
jgi:paraquat-inducible protein B